MKAKRIPPLAVHRPGDFFLITIPNYWGRGATLNEARQQLRNVAGRNALAGPWRVYSVHPATFVNEYGQLCRPKDEPASVMLAEYDPA